jgi:hypothetical protein
MFPEKLKVYRSFLVRCWQEEEISSSQAAPWRFSVEGVSSPLERQGFNNLQDLLVFLHEMLLIVDPEGDPAAAGDDLQAPLNNE